MLTITVPGAEYFDDRTQTFYHTKETTLALEHSLVSISKWEAKWHKPYLSSEEMTGEQKIDYVRCMTMTQNVDPLVFYSLTSDNYSQIEAYMNDPMSASKIDTRKRKGQRKDSTVTSEDLYYQMFYNNVPMECQKWHLNRLLVLLQICNRNNAGESGKKSKSALTQEWKALNDARRKKYNTKG